MIPSQQLELWSSTKSKDGIYIVDFKDGSITTHNSFTYKKEKKNQSDKQDSVYLRLVKGPVYKGILLNKLLQP